MELVTPRLVLREFIESDYPSVREIHSDPEFTRYENAPESEAEAWSLFHMSLEDQNEHPRVHYRWAITLRPNDALRGWIKLTLNNAAIREFEIGWTVHAQERGKGIATEGAREAMRFAFSQLNAHRIMAFCHAGNAASYRVMEKLGMTREGCLRETVWINNAWTDELVYAILKKEFGAA